MILEIWTKLKKNISKRWFELYPYSSHSLSLIFYNTYKSLFRYRTFHIQIDFMLETWNNFIIFFRNFFFPKLINTKSAVILVTLQIKKNDFRSIDIFSMKRIHFLSCLDAGSFGNENLAGWKQEIDIAWNATKTGFETQ